MKVLLANRIAPDGTPRSAASHLGLFCLPVTHKRDARLNELLSKIITPLILPAKHFTDATEACTKC